MIENNEKVISIVRAIKYSSTIQYSIKMHQRYKDVEIQKPLSLSITAGKYAQSRESNLNVLAAYY